MAYNPMIRKNVTSYLYFILQQPFLVALAYLFGKARSEVRVIFTKEYSLAFNGISVKESLCHMIFCTLSAEMCNYV